MKGGVNTPPQENPQENRPNLLSDLPPDMTRSVCQFLGVKAGKIKCVNTEQKNLFEEIAKNTNLELNADVILTDEQIEKFKSQGIKIKLLETHTDIDGVQKWYKNGKLHRDGDQPAVITRPVNGDQYWYQDGKRHRDGDKPAMILLSIGSRGWYQNGKQHRDNGPSRTFADGTEFWYQNGKQHRDDGPAVTYANGTQRWYHNGVLIPNPPNNP
jgi:hypothetical protein